MKNNIYYTINLYNYIHEKIIHYNRNIANCITLIKLIEENYEKYSCKSKILKYINRLFQNDYKIKDTNSIKIIYERKELYYYHRNEGKNNIYINNIKLNIKECFGSIDKFTNKNRNIRKNWKIKNFNKNGKIKKNYIKYNISEDFTKYIERINTIKENLYKNDGKTLYCFINNITPDENANSDVDFEITTNTDKIAEYEI